MSLTTGRSDWFIDRGWFFAIFYAATIIPTFVLLNYLHPLQISDPLSDLYNYKYFYDNARFEPITEFLLWYEPGYSVFSLLSSYLISFSGFIWMIGFVLCSALAGAMAKWRVNYFFTFIFSTSVFFLYFPFSSLSNVALRQGLATAVFLLFISRSDPVAMSTKSFVRWSFFLLCFHFSAAFMIGCIFLTRRIPKKYVFGLWLITATLYVLNLSGAPGAFLNDQLGFVNISLNSLNVETEYTVGFKPLFFALSAVFVLFPLIFSWFGILQCSTSEIFGIPLFRLYFVLNSAAMYTAQLPYHDRFFLWSWVLGPVLVIVVLSRTKRKSS